MFSKQIDGVDIDRGGDAFWPCGLDDFFEEQAAQGQDIFGAQRPLKPVFPMRLGDGGGHRFKAFAALGKKRGKFLRQFFDAEFRHVF